MKAILTLKNEDNTSTIIFEEIKDEKLFSCRNGEDEYTVDLREDFNIYMKSIDHTTKASIKRKGDSNIRITDINGSILQMLKRLYPVRMRPFFMALRSHETICADVRFITTKIRV